MAIDVSIFHHADDGEFFRIYFLRAKIRTLIKERVEALHQFGIGIVVINEQNAAALDDL